MHIEGLEKCGNEAISRFIPENLVTELILPRLPIKSLFRFKVVSASWNSTISGPQFMKSHSKFFLPTPQFLFASDRDYDYFSVPYYGNDELINVQDFARFDCPFKDEVKDEGKKKENKFITLEGSCNGLVCVRKDHLIGLWNPATHQHRSIFEGSESDDFSVYRSWFGYAPSIDDYKIVALFDLNDLGRFDVFSFRAGEWKTVSSVNHSTLKKFGRRITKLVLNDILYWSLENLQESMDNCVVGFNLVNDQLIEVPWMDWLSEYLSADFFVFDGCLSLYCSINYHKADVWTMTQHGDWNSWEKLFSVDLENVVLLKFIDNGKILVKDRHRSTNPDTEIIDLSIIDIRQEVDCQGQRRTHLPFGKKSMKTESYVESLLWPFGTENP